MSTIKVLLKLENESLNIFKNGSKSSMKVKLELKVYWCYKNDECIKQNLKQCLDNRGVFWTKLYCSLRAIFYRYLRLGIILVPVTHNDQIYGWL